MTTLRSALLGLALVGGLACGSGGSDDPSTDVGKELPTDTVQSDTPPPDSNPTDTDPADGTRTACTPREAIAPTASFFTDISEASGIRVGNYDPSPPIPVPINDHSRLGFVDIDGDGWDDLVTHSLFPNPANAGIPFEHLVFRNKGDGTFEDVSDASGLRTSQSGSFLFADVDNDGDQDCYAALDYPLPGHTSQILLNDGSGVFTPLPGSGIDGAFLPQIAANGVFFDANNDGNLDLFVGTGHTGYAAADLFFWGKGDGTFEYAANVLTGGSSLQQPTNGCVTCDYDNDGDLDIFVSTYGVSTANGLNILWENQGGTFMNVAVEKGFASLGTGNPWLAETGYGKDVEPGKASGEFMGSNGFGIDCGDVDNDGNMDVFLTTISHPVNSIYSRKWSDATQLLKNMGSTHSHVLQNVAADRGVPFNEGDVDGAMVDFDNDGRLDLSMSRDKKYEKAYTTDDQKAWFGLMWQQADGTFQSLGINSGINSPDAVIDASLTACTSDATCTDGEACLKDKCRRPCTSNADCPSPHEICRTGGFCKLLLGMKNAQNHGWADIDHDGDLDLFVGGRDTGGGRPNFLFRNDIGHENRWIALRLVGDGITINRDAIGARVTLNFADEILTREVKSSRGMHNSMDTRALHFGLGDRGCDYTLNVRWPDGTTASFTPDDFPEESYLTLSYPDSLTVATP